MNDTLEKQPLADFTERAYLNYSMYVIMDRALPQLADGLKPVQRRIIYAMSELGLDALAKYKKSARTVGDVLGKYHPHGDLACYEAMVLMAQSFSYRYPLVDGQGNWGAPDDPKSFAAMRYTEARLSAYAEILLAELGQGTVEWGPNFDGTMKEPLTLPARLPNILLNGTTGIAVGMATDIPPHNLREVAQACIHLLENPKADIEEVCEYILAPDFTTEAEIITPRAELLAMYKTGRGSVRQRAVYCKEDGAIVITALPHQVSGAKVMEQIAAQMQAKKLPMIEDLRDESDHENPTRLVLVPRSNRIEVEGVMQHLFATTDLENSYRINLNMIGLDGLPKVKNIKEILSEWLQFRKETVRRRLQYRLDKVLARLHILDGLLIAYLNIDEVIAIIRREDKPKPVLMARFQLTDTQAEAILDLKLRHLAKLEEMAIRGEQAKLAAERAELEQILASERRLKTLIRKEIEQDMAQFGDGRRSPLVERGAAQAMEAIELVASEPVTVILSEKGWVRSAKGHEFDASTLSYKAGDQFKALTRGRSTQSAVFFDSTGRSYALPAHTLPSARGQGEPLSGRLSPPDGAQFVAVLLGESDERYVFASDAGYGFVGQLGECVTRNKNGKLVLTVPQGAKVLAPQRAHLSAGERLAVVTNTGQLLVFSLEELPELAKGKGNKLIHIPSQRVVAREEYVLAIAVVPAEGSLELVAGKRNLLLKPKDLEHYVAERGRRGSKLPRGLQRVDEMRVV